MRLSILLAACSLFISAQASANFITNGDFQTCNFDGWLLDADGPIAPADAGDFTIVNNNGDCAAQIGMTELGAFGGFINTLFNQVNLSSVANDTELTLSFDWVFSGSDLQEDEFSDLFVFSIVDEFGTPDEYFINFEDGRGTFTTLFNKTLDIFSLDFAMWAGVPEGNPYTSFLTIDNVSLTQSTAVPAPQTSVLLALGLGFVALRRAKHNK